MRTRGRPVLLSRWRYAATGSTSRLAPSLHITWLLSESGAIYDSASFSPPIRRTSLKSVAAFRVLYRERGRFLRASLPTGSCATIGLMTLRRQMSIMRSDCLTVDPRP